MDFKIEDCAFETEQEKDPEQVERKGVHRSGHHLQFQSLRELYKITADLVFTGWWALQYLLLFCKTIIINFQNSYTQSYEKPDKIYQSYYLK